jgi:AcrR family transcriptional regulator
VFISKALFYSAFSTIFELTSEYRQQYVKMQDEKAKQIYTRDVIQELSRKLIQELSRSIPNVEEMIQEEKTRLIGNLRQLNYYPANIQEAIEDAFEKCFLRSNTIISPEVFDNWFDFFRDNMLVT